ncbi:MAG: hypothetical protein EZS28_005304, partial [Streblomastix strix]
TIIRYLKQNIRRHHKIGIRQLAELSPVKAHYTTVAGVLQVANMQKIARRRGPRLAVKHKEQRKKQLRIGS